MVENQRTIATEGSISGIGLHTGERSRVIARPAKAGSGIQFIQKPNGKISDNKGGELAGSLRRTSVLVDGNRLQTVEHLLAAAHGLGICNLELEVDGPEIPGMDGSALPFLEWMKTLGVKEQTEEREVYKIREPISCYEKGKAISIFPADEFSVAYTLDYDHPLLKNQKVDFQIDAPTFEKEIAPARTFCTEEEAEQLRGHGLGLGANYQNTLVISKDGPLQNFLRFKDECARHKVLDIVGDLQLLGFYLVGRIIGLRSGHSLNNALAEKIKEQRAYGR